MKKKTIPDFSGLQLSVYAGSIVLHSSSEVDNSMISQDKSNICELTWVLF